VSLLSDTLLLKILFIFTLSSLIFTLAVFRSQMRERLKQNVLFRYRNDPKGSLASLVRLACKNDGSLSLLYKRPRKTKDSFGVEWGRGDHHTHIGVEWGRGDHHTHKYLQEAADSLLYSYIIC
jgi:hypothetical protein